MGKICGNYSGSNKIRVLGMRHFLFLQGPHGSFFKRLGEELLKKNYQVSRINLCGGDWLDWHGEHTCSYCGQKNLWGAWIGRYFDDNAVTDLLLFGDWRPMHSEAVTIAKIKNIRVWVFEEGYLRPAYVTMERDGVNGRSHLFADLGDILQEFENVKENLETEPKKVSNPLSHRMKLAFNYGALEFLARPFFPWYKTHRPNGILKEGCAWLSRLANKYKNRKLTRQELKKIYRKKLPFFLFPLQLDSDSQVRLYSPFSGMKDAIIYVLSSFAVHASCDEILVVRNHPMDNGLIDYRQFIKSFAEAIGISERVFFVETGNAKLMMEHAKAMVVLNSTIGMTGLRNGLPVYCVGTSIYAMKGLATDKTQQSLHDFWNTPFKPDMRYVEAFEGVLKAHVLVNGSFYSHEGIEMLVPSCIKKLEQV